MQPKYREKKIMDEMKQWETSAFLIWPNNSQSNGRPLLAGAVTKRRRSRRRRREQKNREKKMQNLPSLFSHFG